MEVKIIEVTNTQRGTKNNKPWTLFTFKGVSNGATVEAKTFHPIAEGCTYSGELNQPTNPNWKPTFDVVEEIVQTEPETEPKIITQLEPKTPPPPESSVPSVNPKYDSKYNRMWAVEQAIKFYQRSSQESVSYSDLTKTAQYILDWIKAN